MRPLELRLRNFRSFFGDGHSFDFRQRRLIGVVGPIGSGKSTILDAIAFALYGRTPRIGRDTKTLIHQRADHTAVELRFEVEGRVWMVVRNIRKRGQSQNALYELQEDRADIDVSNDAHVADRVFQEGSVNSRIGELLGIDFEAFGRSVLLAQGQFARFLSARPAERDKVLKGLFGYERIDDMRVLARETANRNQSEIEKLEIHLRNAEEVQVRLDERREDLAESSRRLDLLETVRPKFEELTERIGLAEERRRTLETELVELRRLAGEIPERSAAEVVLSAAEQARTRLAEVEEEVRTAAGRLKEAEAVTETEGFRERGRRYEQASGLVIRLGTGREAASRAADGLKRAKALVDDAEHLYHEARVAHTAAKRELDGAEIAAREKSTEWDEAERRLLESRHADMSGTLRQELAPGDNCPVCDQPVHWIPDISARDTAAAEQEAAEARRAKTAADGRLQAATGNAAGAKVRLASAEERLAETGSQADHARRLRDEQAGEVTRLMVELECLVGEGDPEAQLAEERRVLEAHRDATGRARRWLDKARDAREEARTIQADADWDISNLRDTLVGLAALLQAGDLVPDDKPDTVRSALALLRAEWDRRTAELGGRAREAKGETEDGSARLAELRAEHGIEASLEAALAEAKAIREQIQADIKRDEQSVSEVGKMKDDRRQLLTRVGSYRRLASDLTDSRFIRFLLDEERAVLSGLGSEHFERLSRGRYRFTEDGQFHVMDLNSDDAIRRADSLSGGETFLASLGLALGLAEMVGRRGGRLDAFFLDEGFGTLDPEHLDLAMEGIESLVADRNQRLVVVVSHVPELRQRIEDLIELDKNPVTGDSIVVGGGAR